MAEPASPPPPPLATDLLRRPALDEGAADLESADPRLEAVARLTARGSYEEAGRAAASVLEAGQRDVRAAGPYLFALFLERGMAAVPVIFDCTLELLTGSWETLRPRQKKEVLAGVGLRWLFKTLIKHLEYHQREGDEAWQAFCDPGCAAHLAAALLLTEPIVAALQGRVPECVEPFRRLAAWLRAHAGSLSPQAPPAPETALPDGAGSGDPAPAAPEAPFAGPSGAGEPGNEGAEANPGANEPRRSMTLAEVPVSAAMGLLLEKLRVFDLLIERRDFVKASVVAADVQAIVESFDPRVYLPSLFTRFFAGLTAHAQELEPLMNDSGSLQLRAIHQLYRVDLPAFLAHGSGPDAPEEG